MRPGVSDQLIKIIDSYLNSHEFRTAVCIGNLPHVNIFNQRVPWATEYKYLGLILDAKVNFAKHIRSTHQKGGWNEKHSKPLDFSQEQARIKAQGSIIQSHSSRPIMLYASPLWTGAAVTHLKRLHTFQNIQLRRATNAP
ncbi:hypothetical protein TNCV_33841 [Trichonephila clavipes]|nr:hypothetical protein TNCV_33841 [Trichonephila clavipes]